MADVEMEGFRLPACEKRTEDGMCLAIGCCEVGDMYCECSPACARERKCERWERENQPGGKSNERKNA